MKKKKPPIKSHRFQELLQIAASNADTTAEQHTENFFAKKIDVETFLKEYMDAKKLSVIRKTKEERLTYQLNELERSTY
jgi:high-affinity K+ transport system ATPase subunit B